MSHLQELLHDEEFCASRNGTSANVRDYPLSLEELVRHKQNYEGSIRDAIIERLDEFTAATGYSPSSIDVEMISVTQVQDRRPRYVLSQVKMRIDL